MSLAFIAVFVLGLAGGFFWGWATRRDHQKMIDWEEERSTISKARRMRATDYRRKA